jgi:hypothetical protein
MWAINNHTPYAADRNWCRDQRGVHHWIVAVKGTFSFASPGRLTLADEQPAPILIPEYFGNPGASSLRYDSDLLATKPCTDVILQACAHAEKGRKAESVAVRARVGTIDKTLLVHGERIYYKRLAGGLDTTAPLPFVTRELRYEAAYGGSDTRDPDPRKHAIDLRNPIGVGFSADRRHLAQTPAPALQYPSGDPASVGPAGFGPLDAAWSPRRQRAGTYDEHWERTKSPLLADDYDDLYASCAPDDQRVTPHLRGGEPVELINLTPDGRQFFELPKVCLALSTHFGAEVQEHRARITSVIVEPEQFSVSVVWQSSIAVPARKAEYLDHTVIREKRYLT